MTAMLFRHEFLRTKGVLAAIFGIDVLVALVALLMSVTGLPLLSQLGDGVLALAAAALTPLVMFGLGYEHWRASFSGRGYLTHSLPVRGRTQVAVALAHAYLWTLIAVVASLMLWVLGWIPGLMAQHAPMSALPAKLGSGLRHLHRQLPGWSAVLIGMLLLLVLLGYLAQIWFSAAVGSEGRMAGTGWGPVVVYITLYLVLQAAMVACMFAVPLVVHLGGAEHLQVHTASVLRMVRNREESMMPLGLLLPVVVAPFLLLRRTFKSWDEKVSLA